VKHAGTREAVVRLDLDGQRARLQVVDHGVGFDPSAVSHVGEHLGLLGMAERARELGWTLTCDSRPGQGTCIRCRGGVRVAERPPATRANVAKTSTIYLIGYWFLPSLPFGSSLLVPGRRAFCRRRRTARCHIALDGHRSHPLPPFASYRYLYFVLQTALIQGPGDVVSL